MWGEIPDNNYSQNSLWLINSVKESTCEHKSLSWIEGRSGHSVLSRSKISEPAFAIGQGLKKLALHKQSGGVMVISGDSSQSSTSSNNPHKCSQVARTAFAPQQHSPASVAAPPMYPPFQALAIWAGIADRVLRAGQQGAVHPPGWATLTEASYFGQCSQ